MSVQLLMDSLINKEFRDLVLIFNYSTYFYGIACQSFVMYFWRVLPIETTLFVSISSGALSIIWLVNIHLCTVMHNMCRTGLRSWYVSLKVSTFERKVLSRVHKSMRPLCIDCGNVFKLNNNRFLKFINSSIKGTMRVVLLLRSALDSSFDVSSITCSPT